MSESFAHSTLSFTAGFTSAAFLSALPAAFSFVAQAVHSAATIMLYKNNLFIPLIFKFIKRINPKYFNVNQNSRYCRIAAFIRANF